MSFLVKMCALIRLNGIVSIYKAKHMPKMHYGEFKW